jgi:hypothetical protein
MFGKLENLVWRCEGDLAARQAIEQGIEMGRGGVHLMLTPEQYAKLKTKA